MVVTRFSSQTSLRFIIFCSSLGCVLPLQKVALCQMVVTRLSSQTSLRFIIFCSSLGCVLPLQKIALCQSPPTLSVFCYPYSYRSLLPHNVFSPTIFWSSNWSYALYLPLCASSSPSVDIHVGSVSSPFLFHVAYIFSYVSQFDSLPNGGVSGFVF